MSNNIQFEIDRFRAGTEKQQAVGILGTFSVKIKNDDGVIAALHNYQLKKTKNGDRKYIESGFDKYTNRDGEEKRAHHSQIWPEKNNWDKQEILVREATRLYEEAGGQPAPAAASSNSSVTQNTSDDEAW